MENGTQENKIKRIVCQLVFESKELTRTKFSLLKKLDMIEHKLKENERFQGELAKYE
tara:strand:+ start:3880 stop:4050 length:171 start_codon:yes stop_codon:yes gene_type:complete